MLIAIRIDNFALVEHLELELGRGLNVLTGETGAGKSIILEAIDVVLGGKAHQRMIRSGANKAVIEATFSLNPQLQSWLQSQEIDCLEDDTLVCSRELIAGKDNFRSRCRLNGILVNKNLLHQLRGLLLEFTAQGETEQLFSAASQRDLLDNYGGEELLIQRQLVSEAFAKRQEALARLQSHRQWERERLQRLDLIGHQIRELASAQLQSPDELTQLETESARLTHVVELQQLAYQAYQLLYQSDCEQVQAAADTLSQAQKILTHMVNYDKQLASILEMIESALNQVTEAAHQLYSYAESLEANPERLEEVEERIRLLRRICRKYGTSLAEVIDYYNKLQQELKVLRDDSQSVEDLEKEYQAAEAQLQQRCRQLSIMRQEAARKLERQLIEQLKPLGMARVQFQCRITPSHPNNTGADEVEFYFSPNPGEALQPLAAIASGGEMSRFLLALKSCFSQSHGYPYPKTLIFDEIDTGVSGKIAQAIADKLHQLSRHHQVLCVTHQPLVAAMADYHFRVEKQLTQSPHTQEIRTVVLVTRLEHEEPRKRELAELTGGNSAQEAMAFADSLLATAARRKTNPSP
ncbi:MAG: DNA repair protein RecN [Geminocystis sp.]|nr:DNA repair protein RecN [Geminocystis sp.]HIK37435.1 DNA repair protein RecN [Geminocystis sp. M7585_C2015_104]MCS7148848.1 DNA repair protein RecN [Geminocystis sp.]MCX8077405.1 DNA repair protein RecN [Geminocystis sp.]MDW8115932.1 DNA repair protein RecN [Geminocystis sp.]